MKCGGAWLFAFAIGLVASSARAAPPEKPFCVVVVPDGRVLKAHLEQADRGLRAGLRAAGGELTDSLPAADLARHADPATGECGEDCEVRMRSTPMGANLVIARVTTVSDRFVLRASMGVFRSDSAAGLLPQLEQTAARVGGRLASSEVVLMLRGGAKSAQWFLDGRAITLGPDRTVKVTPGRHVLRIGSGQGPSALKAVDVVLGDRLVVAFPEGIDGYPLRAPRAAVAMPMAMATPRPGATDRARPHWSASTGFAYVLRERSITGASGAGYTTRFSGGGPEVTALYRPGLGVVRLDLDWTSYQYSTQRFSFGGGNSSTASGGDSVRARGLIGYEGAFGGDWRFAAYGGAGWESHRADDPRNLGLLSSYQRTSLESELAASLNLGTMLRMKRPVEIGAHLGVSPWSSWVERPAGVSGRKPRAGIAASWGAQSTLALGPRWGTTIAYRGEMRSVRFSGIAEAPVSPPIERATVREFVNAVGVSLNRSF